MQDSWLSILGSLASVGSAIWAFFEAKAAARHASKAEALRNELIQRRVIVEVSRVHSESSRILKLVSKIGPTCTNVSTRGLDVNGIARDVEEYSRFLNEHSVCFNQEFQNAAQILCSELIAAVEILSGAKSFEEKKEAGKKIYCLINSFLPQIKQLADDKRESSPIVI